jgi:hypothetical protein
MMPSIRRWTTPILLAGFATMLGGCSGSDLSKNLGFARDAPDEFMVTTRAPLAMPPSFALPTPTPGVPRPQELSDAQKAQEALVPQTALGGPPAGNSPGQEALVQAAGPPITPDIRAEVDQQATKDRPSNGFFTSLMFWRKPREPGIVVDPAKEAQRIRENSALGQSQNTGDTPIVQPKQRALLEGLF